MISPVTGPHLVPHWIPFRVTNRPPSRASVLGNCATWKCVCGAPTALQGRSGSSAGPTRDSVVVCPACDKIYFVIPLDRSHGPPVEVVELYAMPDSATPTEQTTA
jgi:hypothetical protein